MKKRSPFIISVALLSLISCDDSPTGLGDAPGLILFTKAFSPSNAEVWVMRPDGSDARQLTSNDVLDTDPHWSPDGRRIVFTRMSDSIPGAPLPHSEIHVMNADGSSVQKLTDGELSAQSPRWSADGTQIAFDRWVADGSIRIFVMNADGSNVRMLPPGVALYPDWSPDGRRILFIANDWRLNVMNADGTDVQPLGGDAACAGLFRGARWSPDGTRIAYTCEASGGSAIYTMRPNGTDVVRVRPPNAYGAPVWSPDGRYIAFNSVSDGGARDVFVMRSTGGGETRITSDVALDIVSDWNRAP